MAFISEDDIEQAILAKLKSEAFDYNVIICDSDPAHKEDLNDGTGRSSKKMCVLPDILKRQLRKLNPNIPQEKLDEIYRDLTADFTESDLVSKNYVLYKKIRDYIKVDFRKDGKPTFELAKLVDFDNPENNDFTAVSQMWIQGRYGWRRPDILIFVNGLPLVFIELKNGIVKLQEAYNKNLQDYKKTIPNLFAFNQICVLSNGLETKLGAFNATFDYFFEWLKASEDDKPNRKAIQEEGVSANYFVDGLLHKKDLIDYVENFVLFYNQKIKIIAKNHQFIGVNNLFKSVLNREKLQGKLGVFWHTQGSGKSFSMVMFARKVNRKIKGNFSFLIITDREDLDTQIYKNFLRTEVIGEKDQCQPKNSEQLRNFLQTNKPFLFTLIHKFRYDKGKQYPVLTTRNDIIVLVDEAHRTQYKDLAENMRKALPNANFVAFIGTPLLGPKRLTNQWFGNYVSEYNFAQSIADGSTVPLFYSRRVPEVGLKNDFLDDDVVDIIESENLNEAEARIVENSTSRILEVIKRDERLEKIAKDIAHHFPRRGFLGKGLVVSVDKFTAVKMYDKVQRYWEEEKKAIIAERNTAPTKEKRDELTRMLDYMNTTEMAVVISEEADEVEKFKKQGLDITKHRNKMNELVDGVDLENRFKDVNSNLRLVFVCAMWLTGFDVQNLSTLYLDKPMKGHTLMQAIARANRVFPNKPCGIIVDYVNVFSYMQKALGEYAGGSDGTEFPVKDIENLIKLINETIDETDKFLKKVDINLDEMLAESDTMDKLDCLRAAYNKIVDKDENKNKFKVLTNTLENLYESAKPEIFEKHWFNDKFSPIMYLHGLMHNLVDDEKIARAKLKIGQVLDTSVTSTNTNQQQGGFMMHEGKVINLANVDVEALRQELHKTPYKAVEIDNLKEYINATLHKMINKNCERVKFSERYKGIIDRYNAGGTENEEFYNQLVQLIADMKKESERPNLYGLTEEELEIFDLLIKGKELTKAEEQKVILSAKNLYQKLNANRNTLFVADWYKDEQPKAKVKTAIMDTLDAGLPESYDKEVFNVKTELLLNHFIDMAVQGYGWIGRPF